MPQSAKSSKQVLDRIIASDDFNSLKNKLRPVLPEEKPLSKRIPFGNEFSEEAFGKRQAFLRGQGIEIEHICGNGSAMSAENLKGNIENLIGFVSMPVGAIGPLRINGLYAVGDFYVPMATTEGAMVASYHRGSYLISQSGGAVAMCLTESVSRAPCFLFKNIKDAGEFIAWILSNEDLFHKAVSGTTSHGRLIDFDTVINGKDVYLIFRYFTGDAAGQNMVTVATEAVCREIVLKCPMKPEKWFLEGNLSGDKKATMMAFQNARGKKVIAEAVIFRKLIGKLMNTTPEEMARYCKISVAGAIQSGAVGAQGHYANALAAIFIACGQDAACVSEASVGLTDMEVTKSGDLYVSVSLPNLIVGTVGGGTHLPTAKECLKMMDCYGDGKSRKFAEICAAACLAGEISLIGAMASGEFGSAHATFRHKSQLQNS
jgi:hydroxymethylglutaryl-CoA reductase (NADPH)